MQMTQVNRKCSGRMPGLLLLMGMLSLCGCAGRSTDAYLFDQTETVEASGEEETEEGQTEEVQGDAKEESMAETQMPQSGQDDALSRSSVYIVHICGAVQNPGVYELPEGSRVMDAVEAGGGFLEEADQAACNLAQPIIDGCQIYIMTKEESSALDETARRAGIWEAEEPVMSGSLPASGQTAASGNAAVTSGTDAGKVNINTADVSALKTLSGIGDSRAAAIVAYREEHGTFTCIEDIMKVSGIKQAAFEKIKDRITV